MDSKKTHWLQSPNKNYLGHWDLPEKSDLVVTIKSAQWEPVKDPVSGKTESCRVVRFKEKDVKPFICNQMNAQSIIDATGVKYMEDSANCAIGLYVGLWKDKRTKSDVDCIRVRSIAPVIEKIKLTKDHKHFTAVKEAWGDTAKRAVINERYDISDDLKKELGK